MSNPIETPSVYNYYLLGGVRSPGLAVIDSGGDRTQKWENQQAPGFTGQVTIFRGEEPSKVSYTHTLWTKEHFDAMDSFLATLRAGTKKRPPQVYDLSDPALSHNEIKSVAVATIGALKKASASKWTIQIEYTEYRKLKAAGGAVKPAQTDQEKENEALNNQNKALEKELAAKQATYDKENY